MSTAPDTAASLDPRRLLRGALAVAVGLGCLAAVWLAPSPSSSRTQSVEPAAASALDQRADRAAAIAAFLASEIDPLLDEAARRDREAMGHARQRLHDTFQQFHAGVDDFTADVTGWGTRFGVLKRQSVDTWRNWWRDSEQSAEARAYIDGKFRRRIVDEATLEAAVQDVVAQFQYDLRANRNRLLSQVNAAIRASDEQLALMSLDLSGVRAAFAMETDRITRNLGQASVTSGVIAFTGGIVAEEVARRVTVQILTRLATHFAATTTATLAASGGATATTTAAGAAGGSAIGPAGAIVGIGVGLAVGVAVDWWLTARFERQLADQCHQFLDDLEARILHGTGDGHGLVDLMQQTLELNRRAQHEAIYAGVVEQAM